MSSTYRPITPITNQRSLFPQPITALAFDPVSDILWSGNNAGSIVAYYGARGTRGVLFPVGGGLAVKKIVAGDNYVRALGSAGAGIGSWGKGGVNKWYYRSLSAVTAFCNNAVNSPNIVASTEDLELLLISSSTGTLIRQISAPSVITHLAFSHTLLLSGSSDGMVRTHDIRLKAHGEHLGSEASIKAHNMGIQGLEVAGNLVFTIGWGTRQSRPFPDAHVKVYDLRTLRALPPIPFSAGPGFINILPKRSSSVVITSNLGLVNIVDASNPSASEFLQLDVSSFVSSVAVSPTGTYLAFGDSEGTIQLLTAAAEGESLPFNGFDGQPIEWPDTPEHPSSARWSDTSPLNSVGMPHYTSLLLSSWTSQFIPSDSYYAPAPKIPPQVLANMKINDFVGYATLPKELRGKRNTVIAPKKDQARFRSGKSRRTDIEPETPTAEISSEKIPRPYRKVEIEYSKFGVEDFDFGFYNHTEFSGLETHITNSYTNALVQTMHYTHSIRRLAQSHITTNCPNEHCLLCELGFVMRMLEDAKGINCQASNFCKTVGALAQANHAIALMDFGRNDADYATMIQSFHRFFLDHLSSEGNMFPHNPVVIPSAVQSDRHSPAAASITQLLGIDAKNLIVCNNCKAVREKENMTHIVDLIYPRRNMSSVSQSPVDFASVLRNSLIREISHKATCQTCKHFSTFDACRAIPTTDLPPVLAINAAVYNEENLRYWLDRNTTFLKPTVEVRGQIDGIDDPDSVTYELRSIIVQVVTKEQSSHLVSIVKMPAADIQTDWDSPWFVFNDFVVTNVSEEEALSIPGLWKVPAILYLERVDMRDTLDFRGFPDNVDPSILSQDISISPNRENNMIKHELLQPDEIPRPGMLISIDAEFVSMQQEETEVRSDGTKKTLRPARLSLARVSVLRGDGPRQGIPFIDDHIHTSEVIVDYLTEFSGIKYGDLDPQLSRHTLVPLKVAYKKLRLLVDLGCIFIGHGLAKDFRIINLYVPPEQVIDTVDLYFIRARQRRLSLRFLSWFVLQQNIQQETHDSIEDARSALMLYKAYQEFEEQGTFDQKLEEIYREGKQYNFKPPVAQTNTITVPSRPSSSTPTPMIRPVTASIMPITASAMPNATPMTPFDSGTYSLTRSSVSVPSMFSPVPSALGRYPNQQWNGYGGNGHR